MPAARVYVDAYEVTIRTPYDPDFVEMLKTLIPFRHRQWHPDARLWTVDALYEREALAIVRNYFDPVEIDREELPASSPATVAGGDADLALLGLAPDPPPLLLELAYKAQLRLWHPDVNASPEATARTQQIVAAYGRLKERVQRDYPL